MPRCTWEWPSCVQKHSSHSTGNGSSKRLEWPWECHCTRVLHNNLHKQHTKREVTAGTRSCWAKTCLMGSTLKQQLICCGSGKYSQLVRESDSPTDMTTVIKVNNYRKATNLYKKQSRTSSSCDQRCCISGHGKTATM